MKLYTEHKQVILASSSKTRVNYLKQHLDRILVVRHKVDEKKIKDEFIETNFTDLVRLLAKKEGRICYGGLFKKYNYWLRSNSSL